VCKSVVLVVLYSSFTSTIATTIHESLWKLHVKMGCEGDQAQDLLGGCQTMSWRREKGDWWESRATKEVRLEVGLEVGI
jgi:hypothetical protein